MPGFYDKKVTTISMPLIAVLQGDIKFQFKDAGKDKKKKDKMFHFWLNTFFVHEFDKNHVVLEKKHIDKAVSDKGKKYAKTFKVELFFEKPSDAEVAEVTKAMEEQARLKDEKKKKDKGKTEEEEQKGIVLKEEDMPAIPEVEAMFEKFMSLSKFTAREQKKSQKIVPGAKWMLMVKDSEAGGPAAFLHLHTKESIAVEDPDYYSDEDKDEDDGEEKEDDDNDEWILQALYDFSNPSDGVYDYLQFKKGDKITVLKQEGDEWWLGEANGKQGYFPPTYTTNPDDVDDEKE